MEPLPVVQAIHNTLAFYSSLKAFSKTDSKTFTGAVAEMQLQLHLLLCRRIFRFIFRYRRLGIWLCENIIGQGMHPASSRSTVATGRFLLFIDEFFNKNIDIGCSHNFSIQLQSNAI
jgi:hypothetical protein